jgi:hypothetical protein
MLTRRDFLKFGLAAGATLVLPRAAQADPTPSILWIGWDGADYRSVTNLLGSGGLPNLARLHTVRLDCAGCTQTKPGWVEIVNGLEYPQTGVLSNKRFKEVARDYLFFYRLKAALPSYWCGCIFSKTAHTGDGLGKPWHQLRTWTLAGGMELYRHASDVGHPLSVAETNGFLSDALSGYGPPGLLLCHYAEPDETGHDSGLDSPEYLHELVLLDQALGWATSAMQPDIVIVCSDHGFNQPGARIHSDAPHGFISCNLGLVANGVRRDVGYTVARMLGVPLETLSPPLRGKDLRS